MSALKSCEIIQHQIVAAHQVKLAIGRWTVSWCWPVPGLKALRQSLGCPSLYHYNWGLPAMPDSVLNVPAILSLVPIQHNQQ